MTNERRWRMCAIVLIALSTAILMAVGLPLLIGGRSLIEQSQDPAVAGHDAIGYLIFGVMAAIVGTLLCMAAAVLSVFFLGAGLASSLSKHHRINQ